MYYTYRAIDIELEDKLVHLQYWKKYIEPKTGNITVGRLEGHYYDTMYLKRKGDINE